MGNIGLVKPGYDSAINNSDQQVIAILRSESEIGSDNFSMIKTILLGDKYIKDLYKNFKKFILIFSIFSSFSLYAESIKITAACTEYPKFWENSNGNLKGRSVSITEAVLKKSGLKFELVTRPWKRVYRDGQVAKNFMITCIGRTPLREDLFNWVGPTTPEISISFIALKSRNIKVSTNEDVSKYNIGVEAESYTEQYLLSFPTLFEKKGKNKNIYPLSAQKQLLKMLDKKRIDLLLVQESLIENLSKTYGHDKNDYETIKIAFKTAEYLSLSKNTNKKTLMLLKNAYNSLLKEGSIKLE